MSADGAQGLLGDARRAGVYTCDPAVIMTLKAGSDTLGYAWFEIDLGGVTNRETFFGTVSAALHFPQWFGRNWDAFEECLADLPRGAGGGNTVVLRRGARWWHDCRRESQQALDVLRAVSQTWRDEGFALWVLIDTPLQGVAPLPASS